MVMTANDFMNMPSDVPKKSVFTLLRGRLLARRERCPAGVPSPNEKIAFSDGSLRPEFEEWANDIGPLEEGTLVPVWWPNTIEGEQLTPEERAVAFAVSSARNCSAIQSRPLGYRAHSTDWNQKRPSER